MLGQSEGRMETQLDLEKELQERKKAVELLKYWRDGGDSFTCLLYSLIQKANPSNRMRLRKGFPTEVELWSDWYNSSTEDAFFAKHGVIVSG